MPNLARKPAAAGASAAATPAAAGAFALLAAAISVTALTTGTAAAAAPVSTAPPAMPTAPLAAPRPASADHGIAPLSDTERANYNTIINTSRPHSAEVSVSGAWLYDFGGSYGGATGVGGDLRLLLVPQLAPNHPDWRLKFGADICVFHAAETLHFSDAAAGGVRHRRRRSLDAGAFFFEGALAYAPFSWFEVGAGAGIGLAGTYGTDSALGDTDRSGNINWAFQVRPELAFHFSRHATLALSYRLGFFTPVAGWLRYYKDYRTGDIAFQSVEIALRMRF
ncbi:MAG: hypothetical protein LBR07_08085 [Puniceicoccales bacterium]|nr:hypothetical protein [Puniceicoccales bacterium]